MLSVLLLLSAVASAAVVLSAAVYVADRGRYELRCPPVDPCPTATD